MSTLGYVFVAGCNADTFANANDSDMLIYPETSTQRILIGAQRGTISTMTIGSNVGINTSNPAETLSIAGNLSLSNFGKSVIFTSNNNIGIGTSNPTAALHVAGGTTVQGDLTIANSIGIKGLTVYKRDGGNANVTSTSVLGFSNDNTGITIRTTSNNQQIYILTSNTERMRINEQGIVNISSNLTITGHIIPNSNEIYDLGSNNLRFRDLYLSGNTIIFGGSRITASSNGGIVVTNSNGVVADSVMSQITLSNFGQTNIFTSNNRLGIGISNPAASLDVAGNLRLTSNIIAAHTDTSNAPAFTWSNDTNTGMYHQTTGVIGFTTQGSNVMTLSNGVVTINSNLLIMGQLTVSNVTYITSNVTVYASETVQSNLTVTGVTTLASNLTMSNFGAITLFTSNNMLGVGKSNPAYTVDITGNVNFSGSLYQNGSIFTSGGGGQWSNNSTNVFITGSNVGIGTTSPAYSLDVNGTTRTGNTLILGSNTLASSLLMTDIANASWMFDTGAYKLSIQNDNGGSFLPKLTITNAGNVGIGTASPSEALHISGGKIFTNSQLLGTSNDSSNVPSMSFREDSNTGIFHPAANQVGITAAGSNVFSASPSNIILNTSVQMPNTVTFAGFSITQRTGGSSTMTVPQTWTNSGSNVFITGSNVGIGTNTPTSTLSVTGSVTVTSNVILGTSNSPGFISAGNVGMFRNRLINGDMRIDQRSQGATVANSTAWGYTADRWQFLTAVTGVNAARINLTSNETPWFSGFTHAYQYTSPSTVQTTFQQRIELNNCFDILYTTKTLSFWAKASAAVTLSNFYRLTPQGDSTSNTTGTEYLSGSGDASLSLTTTWQYFTVTFPAVTASNVNMANLNNQGMRLCFQSTAASSTTITLTGVQLERGPIATPFEFRPSSIELRLCRRYHFRKWNDTTDDLLGLAYCTNSSTGYFTIPLYEKMRAPYTLSVSAHGDMLGLNQTVSAPPAINTSSDIGFVQINSSGAYTAGAVYLIKFLNKTANTAFIAFDSEI